VRDCGRFEPVGRVELAQDVRDVDAGGRLAVAIERELTPTIPTPTKEAVRLIRD
jgi:hypothetical protein